MSFRLFRLWTGPDLLQVSSHDDRTLEGGKEEKGQEKDANH